MFVISYFYFPPVIIRKKLLEHINKNYYVMQLDYHKIQDWRYKKLQKYTKALKTNQMELFYFTQAL